MVKEPALAILSDLYYIITFSHTRHIHCLYASTFHSTFLILQLPCPARPLTHKHAHTLAILLNFFFPPWMFRSIHRCRTASPLPDWPVIALWICVDVCLCMCIRVWTPGPVLSHHTERSCSVEGEVELGSFTQEDRRITRISPSLSHTHTHILKHTNMHYHTYTSIHIVKKLALHTESHTHSH